MPNNKGGKKYKRNKNVAQENKNTRFKDENESQEYAQITNALGNCRFDVLCFDGTSRLATMCGKMRKRVFVNQGEIVLVSLREWQDSKCDIIDKYNANDVQKLKQKKCIPDFIKLEEKKVIDDDDEDEDDNMGFVFSTDMPSDSEEDEMELDKKSSSDEESDTENDKIDFDEI
jgi:translation initiation factor 1A